LIRPFASRSGGRRFLSLVATIAACAALSRSARASAPAATPDVVVHLSELQSVAGTELSVRSPYKVVRLADGQPIAVGRSLDRGRIEPAPNGVRIGGVALASSALELVPEESGAMRVGGRSYRGALQILRDAGPNFSLRNRVSIDDYLLGVVGAEMPADFPSEALRAQAIIARTYALHGPEPAPGEPEAPLVDSVLSQVYRGVGGEDPRIERAVCDTRGLALVTAVSGKPFTGYFHSTCGGATSDVFVVFGRPPAAPLHGVSCGFCGDAPFARWSATFTRRELEQAAASLGAPGRLVKLAIAQADPAGRATRIALTVQSASAPTARPITKEFPAADFRLALGASKLRSSFLTRIEDLPDGGLRIDGRGFGHGVGLCQQGAKTMAARGYSAEAILLHYFPGSEIRKLYG
jgi:stage II sporulation protein D (peptidoglycan lytic transglycosylase)